MNGLSQAIQKRGLPRALLTDNGAAMVADELTEGLLRLGIVEERKSQNLELYSSGIAERASVIVIAHNTCSRYDRWNDPWGNNHEATAGRVG